jgi:hypothetical protein
MRRLLVPLSPAEVAAKLAKQQADRMAYIAEKRQFKVLEAAQQERAAKVNKQKSLLAEADYWRRQGVKMAAKDPLMEKLRAKFHRDAEQTAAEYAKRGV